MHPKETSTISQRGILETAPAAGTSPYSIFFVKIRLRDFQENLRKSKMTIVLQSKERVFTFWKIYFLLLTNPTPKLNLRYIWDMAHSMIFFSYSR